MENPQVFSHTDIEFLRRDVTMFNFYASKVREQKAKNGSGSRQVLEDVTVLARQQAKKILACNPEGFLLLFRADATRLIADTRKACSELNLSP